MRYVLYLPYLPTYLTLRALLMAGNGNGDGDGEVKRHDRYESKLITSTSTNAKE